MRYLAASSKQISICGGPEVGSRPLAPANFGRPGNGGGEGAGMERIWVFVLEGRGGGSYPLLKKK